MIRAQCFLFPDGLTPQSYGRRPIVTHFKLFASFCSTALGKSFQLQSLLGHLHISLVSIRLYDTIIQI